MTTENDINSTISNSEDSITAEPLSEVKVTTADSSEISLIPAEKRPGRKKRELTVDEYSDTQPLFEQPVVLEGKRSRKPTSRLELSDLETPKKEFTIPQGRGKALGDIAYINYQLTQASNEILACLSQICFGRRINKTSIQEHLKEFHGFEFERSSDDYQGHLVNLNKLKDGQLKSISDILGLSSTVSHGELAENILNFLFEPIDEGKAIPPPQETTTMRTAKIPRTTSKAPVTYNEDDEYDDDFENGDELYEKDETDEDYVGSDEEVKVKYKDDYEDDDEVDDPDDFVYQPGRKTPKKKLINKRLNTRTKSSKRKRAPSTRVTRGNKKSKEVTVVESEQVPMTIDETKTDDDIDKAPSLESNPSSTINVN